MKYLLLTYMCLSLFPFINCLNMNAMAQDNYYWENGKKTNFRTDSSTVIFYKKLEKDSIKLDKTIVREVKDLTVKG